MATRSNCPDPSDPEFWPTQDDWFERASAAQTMCRAAEIDATHSGTPSGRESDWRLGISPGDRDR